jgi:hypothetical protein
MTTVDTGPSEPSTAAAVLLTPELVETYVRDAKLVLVNAATYAAFVAAFAALRIALSVPHLRAAVGTYVVVTVLAMVAKHHLVSRALPGGFRWVVVSLVAPLGVLVVVLTALVELNHGTLFAQASAALVAAGAAQVVDRVALSRA